MIVPEKHVVGDAQNVLNENPETPTTYNSLKIVDPRVASRKYSKLYLIHTTHN